MDLMLIFCRSFLLISFGAAGITFLKEPIDQDVCDGSDASFPCIYTGTYDIPYWSINNVVYNILDLPANYTYAKGVLTLGGVSKKHDGIQLQCVFSNAVSTIATLHVIPGPIKYYYEDGCICFSSLSNPQCSVESYNVTIMNADGFPDYLGYEYQDKTPLCLNLPSDVVYTNVTTITTIGTSYLTHLHISTTTSSGMMNKYYLCTTILATVTVTLGIVLF